MRPEYDFSRAVRGKHFAAYRAGTNVVCLGPDVGKAFADSASVNQALRLLLQLARVSVPLDIQSRQVGAAHYPRPAACQEAQARSRHSPLNTALGSAFSCHLSLVTCHCS